jgi:hypothetical protein
MIRVRLEMNVFGVFRLALGSSEWDWRWIVWRGVI